MNVNLTPTPPPQFRKWRIFSIRIRLSALGWFILVHRRSYCHNLAQPKFELGLPHYWLRKPCSCSCATFTQTLRQISNNVQSLYWVFNFILNILDEHVLKNIIHEC